MGLKKTKYGKAYKVSKIIQAPEKNDQALKEMLVKYGPVSVAIDASSEGFNDYATDRIFSSVNTDLADCKSDPTG